MGVAVATAYTPPTTMAPVKKAIVRNSRFELLPGVAPGQYPPAAISMNYGMASGDTARRDPVIVYDFNGKPDADALDRRRDTQSARRIWQR